MIASKLVIFGTGLIAELASYYFENDSNYEVVAYTVDKSYCSDSHFLDKPLVPFEEIQKHYPPENNEFFIALSYSQMNKLRAMKFKEAKGKGYRIASYISSKCTYLSQFKPGDNAFILEDNTIQPFVRIGENVILWSGNHIGHHSIIDSNCFISSHVVISGNCHIKSDCFLGVNSTIANNVVLEEASLIGAGAMISENTQRKGVYVAPKAVKLKRDSDQVNLK